MVPLMVSPGTRTPPLNSIAAKAERAQVDSGRVLGACLFRARSGHLIGMGTGPRRASQAVRIWSMRAFIGEACILSLHACERKRPPGPRGVNSALGERCGATQILVITKVDHSAASGWAAWS
jgi:hypothetical protein